MSTIVTPRYPGSIDIKGADSTGNVVQAAMPVEGARQWKAWANGALWSLVKGGTLVSAGGTGLIGVATDSANSVSPGDVGAYRYYAWPNKQNTARLWCVGLMCTGGIDAILAGQASGEFLDHNDNVITSWSLSPRGLPMPSTFWFVDNLGEADWTADPGEISISVANNAASVAPVVVTGVTCYEVYRVRPDVYGPDDLPVIDPTSCQSGAPITEIRGAGTAAGDRRSVDGLGQLVFDRAGGLWAETRRSCLYSWWNPAGVELSSSTFVDIFKGTFQVLGRKLQSARSTVSVAACVTNPAAEIQAVADNGVASDTLTITAGGTSPDAWYTGSILIDHEDTQRLEDDAGIPSDGPCEMNIKGRRTTGTNSRIYGLCVGEPRPA